MSRRNTTEDLIAAVRSLLDESNTAALSDERDILPALNRAQDVAANLLARHYEAPLLVHSDVPIVPGQREYPIPEDAFEDRLEKVELLLGGLFLPIKRIDYRDASALDSASPSTAASPPRYYSVVGSKYRLLPAGPSSGSLRIWYLKDPEPLVLSQGRITLVNSSSNYIILDQVGDALSTSTAELNCYINIIDGQSGIVKGTLQINSIVGNKITFKSVFGPNDRLSVLNKTIGNSLSAVPVEPDDFLCTIQGTCIPVLRKPFSNYLIQFAVAEMQRKLGGAADIELKVRDELLKLVERSWVGRETSLRVSRNNRNWKVPIRRFYNV